jgi:hypothetical protein
MYRDNCGRTLDRLFLGILVVTLLVLLGNTLSAQDTLALSSATNGGGALGLALTGSELSAVNRTLPYPPANGISVSSGAIAAGTAAGKTLNCYNARGASTCAASIMNASAISAPLSAVIPTPYSSSSAHATISLAPLFSQVFKQDFERPQKLTRWQCYLFAYQPS